MAKISIRGALIVLALGSLGVACTGGGSPTPPPTGPDPVEPEPDVVAPDPLDATPGEEHALQPKSDGSGQPSRIEPPKPAVPKPVPAPQGPEPKWAAATMPTYDDGALLKHLSSCSKEFAYVNMASIIGSQGSTIKQLIEKLSQAEKETNKFFKEITKQFDTAGVDAMAALKEVAWCDDGEFEVMLIGIAPSKPIEVTTFIQKALAASGEDPGTIERKGDMSILMSPDGDTVAQVSPTLLVLGDRKHVDAASKSKNSTKYKDATKHLVQVNDDDADLLIDETAGNLNARVTIKDGASASDIDQELKKVADHLLKTKLRVLGERLKAAKVAASGKIVVVTGSMTRAQLTQVIQSAVSMDAKDLFKILMGGSSVGSKPPASGP